MSVNMGWPCWSEKNSVCIDSTQQNTISNNTVQLVLNVNCVQEAVLIKIVPVFVIIPFALLHLTKKLLPHSIFHLAIKRVLLP